MCILQGLLSCDEQPRSIQTFKIQKRGCAEICPDGSVLLFVDRRLVLSVYFSGVLVSGKGTRFILANTEQLHAKIQEMSDRIRHLEDAVQKTDSNSPLLASELLTIKSTMGLYSSNGAPTSTAQENYEEKTTNGALPGDAQRNPYTPRADSASADDTLMQVDRPLPVIKSVRGSSLSCIPYLYPFIQENSITFDLTAIRSDVHRLNTSFPLSSNLQGSPESSIAMREYIRSQLPSRGEAHRLWNQARRNALWQYNPHPSSTFFPNLLHHVYSSSSDSSPKPIADIDPRRLALLLMILAVACIVDVPPPETSAQIPPSHSPHQSPTFNSIHRAHLEAETRASRYHDLGRASLCEVPIMEETNVDTVLALFYEVWFLSVWSDGKKAVGEAWGVMGLVAKLAQSVSSCYIWFRPDILTPVCIDWPA